MTKWFCIRCGYIYDEKIGDNEHGVQANTPFESLPDSWVCPRCKAEKSSFRKVR